jgi:hypothetical protein
MTLARTADPQDTIGGNPSFSAFELRLKAQIFGSNEA